MDLLEYQGKELFSRRGLAVPAGRHAASPDAAVEAAEALGISPATVKNDWAFARAWLKREATARGEIEA